jgi:hypothetical protein
MTRDHSPHSQLCRAAAGFEALYLSGAAMTASMGLSDLGIITVDEVASIRIDGGTTAMPGDMQIRIELYDLIALANFEARSDASIGRSVVPIAV